VSRTGELLRRIGTASLAIPLFVLFLYVGGWPLWGLVAIALSWALREFHGLEKQRPLILLWAGAVVILIILTLTRIFGPSTWTLGALGLTPVFFMMLYPFMRLSGISFDELAKQVLVVLYLSIAGASVLLLRDFGFLEALFPFVLIWICDTGAYGFGKLFGRRKLPAALSPNKTIEGLLMGLVCACVFALIASLFTRFYATPLGYLGAGLIVGVIGQVGDLAESAIKREVGVKDSSDLLPGHGGILDRIDSILATMPVYVAYVLIVGRI
jgi:phosphatidate cytidylyltransferase